MLVKGGFGVRSTSAEASSYSTYVFIDGHNYLYYHVVL